MSLRLRSSSINLLAAVCVGGPPRSLPGVRWPLAGVWRAGAAPSGSCGGLVGLDPRLVSLALVFWCAVVRCAASCRVSLCCVVLVRAVLRCALLGRAVLRRAVLWCAALCRVPSRRAVVCCVLGCLVVVQCTVVRCGAVCRAASCFAVLGDRRRLVRPVSWCGVRVGVCLACGWGMRLGVGWLAGSVLWRSACAARAGGSGRCPRGCPPWGLVPWSRVVWGSLPLALGAVAAPSSSSVACEVALALTGVVAWR